MRRSLVLLAAITAPLLVGCGDDAPFPAGQPDPSYIGRAVDSGFRPDTGGFAFPNFDHVTYGERFTIEDLLERFGGGPRLCRDGVVDPCIPTDEAQTFIDTVESSRRAGHCEGMVLLAAARHHWGLAPETASLPPDDWVIDAIIFGFATIFLPEVQAEVRAWESSSLADTVALLAVELEAGRVDFGMGLYTDGGGHEVLPYAIEYPSENLARVLVYDPNWPLVERRVDIDLATETWRFSFAGEDPDADPYAWTGDSTMLDLTSIPVRAAALEARGVEITPR
jgi:hypothetical protein